MFPLNLDNNKSKCKQLAKCKFKKKLVQLALTLFLYVALSQLLRVWAATVCELLRSKTALTNLDRIKWYNRFLEIYIFDPSSCNYVAIGRSVSDSFFVLCSVEPLNHILGLYTRSNGMRNSIKRHLYNVSGYRNAATKILTRRI